MGDNNSKTRNNEKKIEEPKISDIDVSNSKKSEVEFEAEYPLGDYRNGTTWNLHHNPKNKKPGDEGYSWHHNTVKGRSALKTLDAIMYID